MAQGLRWVCAAALAWGCSSAQGVALTATETSWLAAAMPVLAWAREIALPLDIVVQPQATPGETPLGMAWVEGRCKLVLSMRGNPEAQATLDRIGPGLQGTVVEAIAAHEIGHCWRHVQQSWGTLPAGMQEIGAVGRLTEAQAVLLRDMWRTRREEGYADLVGLAWTLQHHAARYGEVLAWNLRLRADPPLDTGPHDTRVWLRLAEKPSVFAPAATIFEQVEPVWAAGLRGGD